MEIEIAPYAPRSVLETLPCSLPLSQFDPPLDAETVAAPFISALDCLSIDVLSPQSIWRDTFALTGSLRTIYSPKSIAKAWSEICAHRQVRDFSLIPGSAKVMRLDKDTGWINVSIQFRTGMPPSSKCSGFLSLFLDESGKWKIWLIRTILEQLEDSGDVDELLTPDEHSHRTPDGVDDFLTTSNKTKGDDQTTSAHKFDCIIIGAGQAGLGSAGRLQALGISYVVLERHAHIGDNWMKRYDSARLHTSREYNHLPFNRTFPLPYQEYLTKYDLAKGYKDWIHKFGIDKNIWFSTALVSGTWDNTQKLWALQINRSGKTETVLSHHVIMAAGGGGQLPIMPVYAGQEDFQGTVLHSAEYRSATPWKGKSGIVVGTANTAHDVVDDMVEAGLSTTTMVQRTRTYVMPCEYFKAISDRSYNANVSTVDADREGYSMPYAVTRLLSQKALHGMASKEPERFDALERAGFRCERYGDIMYHILEKLGGHYVDVGCSEKISKGLVCASPA